MGNPIVTFGYSFTPDTAAALVQIDSIKSRTPRYNLLSGDLTVSLLSPKDFVFIDDAICPAPVILGTLNPNWFIVGSGVQIVAGGVQLSATGSLNINLYRYIFPYSSYNITIYTRGKTAPILSINGEDAERSASYARAGLWAHTYEYKTTVPYLALSLTSGISTSPVVVMDVYCRQKEFLYSTVQIGGAAAYYGYEALWHHQDNAAYPIRLLGSYGETIPPSEYTIQYSPELYDQKPRCDPSRTWLPLRPLAPCVIRVILHDRLDAAYAGKPLYLVYNKVPPSNSADKTVVTGYRELISPEPLAALPSRLSVVPTRARIRSWKGVALELSGDVIKTARPKIHRIFAINRSATTDGLAYPQSFSPTLYWNTPEHVENRANKISWEPVSLFSSTIIKADSVSVSRKPYPDQRPILLFDIDPNTGIRYPDEPDLQQLASANGSVLIYYDNRDLEPSSIIGINARDGLIQCNVQLEGHEVWLSYTRTSDWWTFDRPYLLGPQGLTRNIADDGEVVDPPITVGIHLLPSYAYLACTTLYTAQSNYIFIDRPHLVLPADSIRYIFGMTGLTVVVLPTATVPYITELPVQLVSTENGRLKLTMGSDVTWLTGRIMLVADQFQNEKLIYSYTRNNTTFYYTAHYSPEKPTEFFSDVNPFFLRRMPLAIYQNPFDLPGDYKLTPISTEGGGMLPDDLYNPNEKSLWHPYCKDFADEAQWQGRPYQADSTIIVGVSSYWLKGYAARANLTRSQALDKIKEIASKYCSYGTYVEILDLDNIHAARLSRPESTNTLLPLPFGMSEFVPRSETLDYPDLYVVDLDWDWIPHADNDLPFDPGSLHLRIMGLTADRSFYIGDAL